MKLTRIILIFCATVIFLFVLGYIYISSARVVGFEFNSATWQIRHFEFYADPFTNKQLIGLDNTGPVKWTIDPAITSILNPGPSANARWDLIELDDHQPQSAIGPAAIIADLLTARRSGWQSTSVVYWSDWTKNNPTEAKVFWTAVQVLTIHGAYSDIPKLLDLSKLSGQALQNEIDSVMANSLRNRAKRLQLDGQSAEAKAAAMEGLKFDPESDELRQLAGDADAATSKASQP